MRARGRGRESTLIIRRAWMVADRHGLAGAGMAAAAAAMLLPAALLHDDDAMACLLCLPADEPTEPLLYQFKISSGETRERERPTNRRFVGCLAVALGLGPVILPFSGRVHPLAVTVASCYPTQACLGAEKTRRLYWAFPMCHWYAFLVSAFVLSLPERV